MTMRFDEYLIKIQAITKIGLMYSTDPYAIENYQELEQLSKEMIEKYYHVSIERNNYFSAHVYPTPNISVRVAIFNEKNQILLVQEANDGYWSMPGGWCDIGDTASEAGIKEVKQETGYDVKITKFLGLLCYSRRKPSATFGYVSGFKAEIIGGKIDPCHEITQIGYFDLDHLPPLSKKMAKSEFDLFVDVALNDLPVVYD